MTSQEENAHDISLQLSFRVKNFSIYFTHAIEVRTIFYRLKFGLSRIEHGIGAKKRHIRQSNFLTKRDNNSIVGITLSFGTSLLLKILFFYYCCFGAEELVTWMFNEMKNFYSWTTNEFNKWIVRFAVLSRFGCKWCRLCLLLRFHYQ